MSVKTLQINDRDVSAHEDETILDIAFENGIQIPRLCWLEGLSAVGACRMCMVEVKGSNQLVPACVTRVEEGMEIITENERLQTYRRTILEMLFAEGNHVCAVCVANGNCELQWLAEKVGMDHTHLPYRHTDKPIDASHDRFTLDHNRCVMCTRCVRVCDEIEGAHTLDVMGRGIDSRIIADMNEPWGMSKSCTSCGKCVQVCPTGALFENTQSVGETHKEPQFLTYLQRMRERGI